MGSSGQKFSGILNKPISSELRKGSIAYHARKSGNTSRLAIAMLGGSLSEDDDYLCNCDKAYKEQFMLRMDALLNHYGIKPTDSDPIIGLALKLAESFVPAFKNVHSKKRGPKTKWTEARYSELAADIELVKQEKGCGDLHACRLLIERANRAGKGRYKSRLPIDRAAKTLNARLVEARNPINTPFGIASLEQKQLLIELYGSTNIRE